MMAVDVKGHVFDFLFARTLSNTPCCPFFSSFSSPPTSASTSASRSALAPPSSFPPFHHLHRSHSDDDNQTELEGLPRPYRFLPFDLFSSKMKVLDGWPQCYVGEELDDTW